MLSPRRSAQFGLWAASLTLVASITVLVAGSTDAANANANGAQVPANLSAPQVAPLASGQLGDFQIDLSQRIASAK